MRPFHNFIASKGWAAPARPHSLRASCGGPAPRSHRPRSHRDGSACVPAGSAAASHRHGSACVPAGTAAPSHRHGPLCVPAGTAAPVPIATVRGVSRLDAAAAPGHRCQSSPAVPLFPPGTMNGLGPQRELEEAAALERRRRRELLRRERIFNPRIRTIGVRAGRKGGKAPCPPGSSKREQLNAGAIPSAGQGGKGRLSRSGRARSGTPVTSP